MNTEIINEVERAMNSEYNTPEVLTNIVNTLEEQRKVKNDIVVPSGYIKYDGEIDKLIVDTEDDSHIYKLSELAHEQIADKLGIPRSYYKKLQIEYPMLLERNINMWLSKKEKTKYLLRTFNYKEAGIENVCRAMLSNRYNIMDNYDVLVTALESIQKSGIHVEIVKAEVTDRRMYIHVVAPEIHNEAKALLDGYLENRSTAKVGEGIIAGMILQNSEVGMGRFSVAACSQILQCKNGMHDRAASIHKTHLGAAMEEGVIEWSQNTRNKNIELIMAQVEDGVKTFLSEKYLGNLVSRLTAYKEDSIEHPETVVEKISSELQIPEEHRMNVLRNFLRDGGNSSFDMLNAVTRETQKMNSDIRYDIEGDMFNMLPRIKSFDKEKPQSRN